MSPVSKELSIGRGLVPFLVALGLASGLLVFLLVFLLGGGSREGGPGEKGAPVPARSDDAPGLRPAAGDGESRFPSDTGQPDQAPDLSLGDLPGAPTGRTPADKDRFRGRGSIRGQVHVAGGAAFPSDWTLRVLPSFTLVGREFAEERTVEFTNGQREFALSDLPFGGYDLIASAPSANGLRFPVLLERGSESPYVSMQMTPAGVLDGRVLDHEGSPAAGVPITLLDPKTRDTRDTRTDVLGRFRFEEVLDNPYELILGRYENPILNERTKLRFSAPSMTLGDVELPPLARIDLQLIDERDLPLANVTVRGSGRLGGTIDGSTDSRGLLSVQFLPAGRYRIRFTCEGYGSRRNTIAIAIGDENAYTIQLMPSE